MLPFLVAGAVICAVQSVRANRLISSALYLAAVSMLTALILYDQGARETAVVELSVGAGLVTVLFVFAIAITAEDAITARQLIPAPIAWTLAGLAVITVGLLALPPAGPEIALRAPAFPDLFWDVRGLDALVQVGLIFAGVMGILGLLVERDRGAL